MKVSIIIRAFNSGKTLTRAIRSALSQRYEGEYEVVIVNDGSSDGSGRIIQQFSADPRVRLVNQEHQGHIAASNAGFEAAQGDIVMLLDADDEALPDFVSASADALADPSVDYAYGEYVEEYEGAQENVRPSDPFKAPAGAFAWRREKLVAEGGFTAGSIFPEYEILLRTWGRWKGRGIPSPLFIYHRSTGSMTGNSRLVRESIESLRKKYPERALEIAGIRSYILSA